MIKRVGLILYFLSVSIITFSQTLKGKIIEKGLETPVPFANIFWKNSGVGNIADQNGDFIIQAPKENDSLVISSIGFKDLKISKEKAITQKVFILSSENIQIENVNIVLKKRVRRKRKTNPAYILHKKVVAHRDRNDLKRQKAYQCNVYNKVEVDLNNVDSSTKHDILLKPISFVFENIDTSTLPKPFVPIFMAESYSNYYFKTNPKQEKDYILAAQNTGLKIPSLAQFTGNTYTDFNIYREYINLFQKSFVSPLADQAWISYNFYLMDSTKRGDTTFYRLDFFPRRKHDLTFKGFMYVDNKTYGVSEIHLEMAEKANVNFLKWLTIDQKYSLRDSVWQMDEEKTFMDVNPLKKRYGFYVQKKTIWTDYVMNKPKSNEFYNNADLVSVSDSAYEKGGELLKKYRAEPLTEREAQTYQEIDSAMQTGYMKVMKNLTQMMYTGYYPFKHWEYGPYFTSYSWNDIEGQRARIGFQTTQSLFKKTHLEGYYAYGFGDQKSKFKGKITQFYGLKKQWRFVRFEYMDDYKILSASENAFQEDNIMASITRRSPPKFTHTKRYKVTWLHEWFNGINNSITLKKEEFKPIGTLTYLTPAGDPIDNIKLNSVTFGGRFAYQEKFVNYGFRRLSMNTRKPRIDYKYTHGFTVNNEGFDYHKAEIKIADRFYFGFTGYSEVILSAGKIWGDLPYPLLLNHQGNDSYYYDKQAFNLMNPFEYVSDQHLSAMVHHNFNGMFFNGVPLLRKLHLRSFIFARGVYGNLRDGHEKLVILPDDLSSLPEPYLEAGFGIENIFHIIRLDFIWRLTNNSATDVQQFGVTFNLVPSF
jgi:hypothetical protein